MLFRSPPKSLQNEALASPTTTSVKIGSCLLYTSRVLVPGTVLSGASVLLLCDLVSKLFTLPINAIPALLGIPIVVWVVLRNKSVTA